VTPWTSLFLASTRHLDQPWEGPPTQASYHAARLHRTTSRPRYQIPTLKSAPTPSAAPNRPNGWRFSSLIGAPRNEATADTQSKAPVAALGELCPHKLQACRLACSHTEGLLHPPVHKP
jgi:hypothetical protein